VTVALRDVAASDLTAFYEYQCDPAACAMAELPSRDEKAFRAHWAKVLADRAVAKSTILSGGEVAGYLVAWPKDGVRLIGYWLGPAYWGRGIASAALALFVETLERPLAAYVAAGNASSIRVLEKCGFVRDGTGPHVGADGVSELKLVLR
jgi:RimJ/RimL family protein N-acetyltransferase